MAHLEAPSKAKTIEKYLGKDWRVVASVGHVRDLPKSNKDAVDIEGGLGTLHAYASLGANELPASNVLHEGPVTSLGKTGAFMGSHILVPRRGIALHIDAIDARLLSPVIAPGIVLIALAFRELSSAGGASPAGRRFRIGCWSAVEASPRWRGRGRLHQSR